jgi:hypothetical protein
MISDFMNIKTTGDFIKVFITFLIVLLINVLIIRFLWNTVLVKYVSILSPVRTLLDTLLLSIALTMLRGPCCQTS